MKTSTMILLVAAGVGGYLLYQQAKKPKGPFIIGGGGATIGPSSGGGAVVTYPRDVEPVVSVTTGAIPQPASSPLLPPTAGCGLDGCGHYVRSYR